MYRKAFYFAVTFSAPALKGSPQGAGVSLFVNRGTAMLSSHTLGLTIRIREHSSLCELAGWWRRGKLSWPRATFDAPDLLVMKINTFEEENVLLCPQSVMCLTKVKGANMFCFIDCMKAKKCFDGIGRADDNVRAFCGELLLLYNQSKKPAACRPPPQPSFFNPPSYHFPQLLIELQL